MMKLRVLGCSGGIGRGLRTTSLWVDHDILIDAGTGLADLPVEALATVDHVFLTHAHLDHIAALPLLIDTVADRRQTPLVVYGTSAVLDVLRAHVFNWSIWPDFSVIPSAEAPLLRFQPLAVGEPVELNGRYMTALPVEHTVPAAGYQLDSGSGSVVFSGDTGPCDAFWAAVNQIGNLRGVIIECAFPNREQRLAEASGHLCPAMLASELHKLKTDCAIYITHLKPGQIEMTMREIEQELAAWQPRMLYNDQVIEF